MWGAAPPKGVTHPHFTPNGGFHPPIGGLRPPISPQSGVSPPHVGGCAPKPPPHSSFFCLIGPFGPSCWGVSPPKPPDGGRGYAPFFFFRSELCLSGPQRGASPPSGLPPFLRNLFFNREWSMRMWHNKGASPPRRARGALLTPFFSK